MKKMRRLLCLLLLGALLAGCGGKGNEEPASIPVLEPLPDATIFPEPEPSTPPEETDYYNLIAVNSNLWLATDEDYYSAVTDLDGNGRPEVLTARYTSDNCFEVQKIYEVDASGKALTAIALPRVDGTEMKPRFYWENGGYLCGGVYYFFSVDQVPEGELDISSITYVTYKKGDAILTEKVSRIFEHFNEEGDQTGERFYDADDKEISAEEYFVAYERVFGGEEAEFELKAMGWSTLTPGEDLAMFAAESLIIFLNDETGEYYGFSAAFYLDPAAPAYRDLGDSAEELPGMAGGNLPIRFTADDATEVKLQRGEWIESLNYFLPIEDIFTVTAESGKVYQFDGLIADGRPEYRITMSNMAGEMCWIPQNGDEGPEGVLELYYAEPEGVTPGTDAAIGTLCRVYAAMLLDEGDEEAVFDNHYWQSVGNAALLGNFLQADTNPDGCLTVPAWLVEGLQQAMFPWREQNPDADPAGLVIPEGETDIVRPEAMAYDDAATRVQGVGYDLDGRLYMDITVVKSEGEMGVIVYLAPDASLNPGNPFGYVITGAAIAMG